MPTNACSPLVSVHTLGTLRLAKCLNLAPDVQEDVDGQSRVTRWWVSFDAALAGVLKAVKFLVSQPEAVGTVTRIGVAIVAVDPRACTPALA